MNQNIKSNIDELNKKLRDRLDVWRDRLIDISNRNQSINFRDFKTSTFKIELPDYESLIEKLLLDRTSLRPVTEIVEELKHDEMLIISEAKDPNSPFINLTRLYNTSIQDMGVNVVHLAIGFLEWYERDDSEIAIKSPILLLPVRIYKSEIITQTQLPFRLQVYEDEIIINKALIERLKRDFSIVMDFEFDYDDQIQSTNNYINEFNRIAESNSRWKILKEANVGNFNYYGFPIYADLKNLEEKLISNPLVRAMNGIENYNQDISCIVEENELDDRIDPKDTFQILDADSSQQKAISAAKGNITFVMHGPPGTGKSQTIGNIISECLSQNKKVLFVSAKEVALKVVKNRLDDKKIGQFCLNLHDWRSKNRKELFKDIDKTWSVKPFQIDEASIDEDLSRLKEIRGKLNEYVTELSSKSSKLKITPYQAHGELSLLSKIPDKIFEIPNPNKLTRKKLGDILSEIKNLESYKNILSEHDSHVWFDANIKHLGIQEKQELTQLLNDIYEKVKKMNDGIGELQKSIPVQINYLDEITKLIEFGEKYKLLVLKEDINAIKRQIKSFDKNIIRYFDPNYSDQLKILKSHLRDEQELDSDGWWWRFSEKTVFSDLKTASDIITGFIGDIKKINDYGENQQLAVEKWIDDHRELPTQILQKTKELSSLIKDENNNSYNDLDDTLSKIQAKKENIDALDEWIKYKRIVDNLNSLGIGDFVNKAIEEKFEPDKLVKIFKKRIYTLWLDNVEKESKILREFDTTVSNNLISEFRDLDKKQQSYAIQKITNQISLNFPSRVSTSTSKSNVSILLKEINKSRAHMSMRRLLKKIPDTILRIKPCIMMSPRTVSTYLGNDLEFDVVIFDEASQLFPEEALASIIRAKQVIIAGDQQQLPPTNFFKTQNLELDDNEIAEDIEGFDSILDLACATTIPNILLNWHYRSQSEDLINFSNYHFYDNKLQIFPGNNKIGEKGVFFNFVEDGTYDYGKSRENRVEADFIVKRIFELLEQMKGDSIGIVTFNIAQRNYIENKIDFELNKFPHLKSWFMKKDLEAFFIKNLESVQGDERDIIFFSMLYGPDRDGKVRGPYGAINRQGGEKRLNVAVTRAKKRVEVYSSMRGNDLKATMTGTQRFKDYLNYAENGMKSLGRGSQTTGGEIESPFEDSVKDALQKQGYVVESQVGVGSYRIDLAIVDQESPGRYKLGIECDGATYHSSYSARTRDRLRQEILEEKYGWQIHRIWSRDWVRNETEQLAKIKEVIDKPYVPILSNDNEYTVDEFEIETTEVPPNIAEIIKSKCDNYVYYDELHSQKYIKYSHYGPSRNYTGIIIDHILDENGPITFEKLLTVLAKFYGHTKVGSNFRKLIKSITSHLVSIPYEAKNYFILRGTITLGKVDWSTFMPRFNKTNNPINDRKCDAIPIQELTAVAREILKIVSPFEYDDLITETARVCGFKVTGVYIGERIMESVNWGIDQKYFSISSENKVSINPINE